MPIPSTAVEVRFRQLNERPYGKFLLPGVAQVAQNVHQLEDGLFEKRDGYGNMDKTCDTGSITSAYDLGLVSNRLTMLTDDAIRIRIGSSWVHTDRWNPAFGSYRTVINGHGFRPSSCVDNLGRTWHFTADQAINTSTGSTRRQPIYRVEDSNGKEVVSATLFAGAGISSGKAIAIGSRVLFYYHVFGVGINVVAFDTATPGTAPAAASFYSSVNVVGFDVRVASDTTVPLVMAWGTALNGAAAAVAVFRGSATTGLVVTGPVYSTNSDSQAAMGAGCLAKNDASGRGFLGAVSHLGTTPGLVDKVDAVEINTTTLACTFTNLIDGQNLDGVHQLTAIVNADNDLDVFWSDCREIMNAAATMPPVRPKLWRLRLDFPSTVTATFIGSGSWVAAEPVVVSGVTYLIVGHESRFSWVRATQITPQRCYSLMEMTNFDVIARAMYEARGGDCDHRAGAGVLTSGGALITGSMSPPTSVSGNTISANVSHNHDGLNGFSTVRLSFDLAPTLGPRIHLDNDMLLPGGYPRRVASWLRSMDMAPQFFPEHVGVTAQAGGGLLGYAGTWDVCATYVHKFPDGSELESQPSFTTTGVVTTSSQYLEVTVPTLQQHGTSDSNVRTFIRISIAAAGSTLQHQFEIANSSFNERTTVVIPSVGTGPNLYTEGGVVENSPPPPFKYGFVWDKRVFVGGCAEAGNIYHTKLLSREKAPQFVTDFRFSLGARDYAGGAVDRNYAAFFHDGGISVISAGGPSDVGGENYRATRLETATQTCTNPRSVVTTSKGLVFQGLDDCIYLLDRSLQVVFVGSAVSWTTLGNEITSAEFIVGKQNGGFDSQQVRLTLNTGRIVVYDLLRLPAVQQAPEDAIGTWYVWPVASLVPVASVVKDGAHHVLGSDGTVWNQVQSQAFDAASTFIPMSVTLRLSFQGIVAFLRCLRGVLMTKYVGPHVLQLSMTRDGVSTPFDPVTVDTSKTRVDFRPNPSKASHFTLTIEEQQHASELNKGFALEGLGFEIQRQPGLARGESRAGNG